MDRCGYCGQDLDHPHVLGPHLPGCPWTRQRAAEVRPRPRKPIAEPVRSQAEVLADLVLAVMGRGDLADRSHYDPKSAPAGESLSEPTAEAARDRSDYDRPPVPQPRGRRLGPVRTRPLTERQRVAAEREAAAAKVLARFGQQHRVRSALPPGINRTAPTGR